jgi:hypothetical protein
MAPVPPVEVLPERTGAQKRRRLKFTPFPEGPVDWMMEQSGAEFFMFSTTSRPRRVAGIRCRSSTMRSLALAQKVVRGELVRSVAAE